MGARPREGRGAVVTGSSSTIHLRHPVRSPEQWSRLNRVLIFTQYSSRLPAPGRVKPGLLQAGQSEHPPLALPSAIRLAVRTYDLLTYLGRQTWHGY